MYEHATRPQGGPGSDPREGAGWHGGAGPCRGQRFHQYRGGFGPHGFGPHGFGPHGRARRGNVKAAVLALLDERPMHGYEIMQELETRSSGFWRPSPGSVYPTLQLLEDQGLVKGEDVEGKRVFSLTDEGKTEAERITAQGEPWAASPGGPEGNRFRLRQGIMQLGAAVKQVGMAGTAEQVDAALEILAEARKRIYALLAEAD